MISKTKSDYHVTLQEAKRHLRLDDDFTQDDDYIQSLIKAAHEIAENYIEKDITKTTDVLIRYDFAGGIIRVNEGNLVSITSIEIAETETPLADFLTYVYRDSYQVDLDSTIDTTKLTLTFITGYLKDACPYQIRQAILIKIGDLYDFDRASSVMTAVKQTGVFETLLNPFKAIYFNVEREN